MNEVHQRLIAWKSEDEAGVFAVRMWRHTLAYDGRAESERRDGSGALPYVPVEPETLGTDLSDTDAVLDIGCLGGYGLFDWTQRRLSAGLSIPRMTGVDTASSSVELGRWMQGTQAMAQVCFVQAQAETLPFADAVFKTVVARLLLPYVDMKACLQELKRVLVPDGLVYVQVHGPRYYGRQGIKQLGGGNRWRALLYYMRPLLAAAWFKTTGQQLSCRLFRETAISEAMLDGLMQRHGLSKIWSKHDAVRPFAVYRKTGALGPDPQERDKG